MSDIAHPAVIVDGALCRLVENAEGRFTVKTWMPAWRRWAAGGAPPVRVLLEGRPPTREELRRLGLRRVPT